jgi:hypothetical protein
MLQLSVEDELLDPMRCAALGVIKQARCWTLQPISPPTPLNIIILNLMH